jgi:7-carboxy-7-deazaguanine synthase
VGEAEALLADLPPVEPSLVVLMPLGTTAAELAGRVRWLGDLCRDRGYRFSPRLQIDLWGGARGT